VKPLEVEARPTWMDLAAPVTAPTKVLVGAQVEDHRPGKAWRQMDVPLFHAAAAVRCFPPIE
jgi:hypothetical protein